MKVRFRVVRKKEKREICGVQVKYEQYPKIVAQKREEEKREKKLHTKANIPQYFIHSVFLLIKSIYF